jgi:addiction module HigA family antidote
MPVRDIPPIHPGEHLAEFLGELGIDPGRAAADLRIPTNRIETVLCGTDRITADMALRYFGTLCRLRHALRGILDVAAEQIHQILTPAR